MTSTTASAADYDGLLLQGGQWRGRSFTGLRVAVLAPGREAALIVPDVVRTARSVKVFQEEPDWLVAWHLPLPRLLARPAARLSLRWSVPDPWTRRRLTPDGRFNTRRPRVDGRYYAALRQPGCTLITWPVYAFVPDGVRSAEGIEHRVDCIVLGTSSVFATASSREDVPA
ncbi:FAD-dependent oxidoreductase [Nocardioides sp. Root614]|nr:FAD-dependent oxidoreductase [Nocardioides sp. Root614]KRA93459.1 FAD-dependent oxidoreductase [Nocardioides sp. Root682]